MLIAEELLLLALDPERGQVVNSADQPLRVGLAGALIDGLIEQGVLGRQRERVLLFPVTRHPVLQPAVRDRVVAELRAAAQGNSTLPAPTAVLLALSGPCRLLITETRRRRAATGFDR